jgi:hypothetical protein
MSVQQALATVQSPRLRVIEKGMNLHSEVLRTLVKNLKSRDILES